MQPQVRYVDVEGADTGVRLDNFLRRLLKDVPKSRIYRVIRSGEVRVNRGRARPSTRLAGGDRVRLPPLTTRVRDQAVGRRPPDAMIERASRAIARETPDYLLLAKPPDMAVHAGSGVDFGVIECLRAAKPEEYLELVHRLDRGTSGALLVARSRPARRELARALAEPRARKRYLALVEGRWPENLGRISEPLNWRGQAQVRVDRDEGKPAETVFEVVGRASETTLVSAELVTGRKHQIRVHAAHAGCPVAGDRRYGESARADRWRRLGLKRPFLHAHHLSLPWRDQWITADINLPADLENLLEEIDITV